MTKNYYVFSNTIDGQVVSQIYVPNSFTPNQDGINDYFGPVFNGFTDHDMTFKIYSRNELVFETYSPNVIWDGKIKGGIITNSAIYRWELEATDSTGYTYLVEGNVNLML